MTDRKTWDEFSVRTGLGIPVSEIEKVYREEEAKLVKAPMSPEAVQRIAWAVTQRKILDRYGGLKQVGTISNEVLPLEGYLIGSGEFRDRAQEMREKAEKAILGKGLSEAVAGGLTDLEGKTLDTRKKLFGKPNTGFGEPLDPKLKLLEMTLFGAFREKGSDEPFVFTKFQTSNDTLAEAWGKIKFPDHAFKPCTTYGKIKVNEYGYLIYGSAGAETRTVFKGGATISVEAPTAVREALGLFTVDIVEAYDVYLTWLPQNKDGTPDMTSKYVKWDAMIAVEGIISDIQWERRDFWKGIPAKIFDPEDVLSSIDIYLPSTWNHNFGEYTTGIAYGKPDEVWMRPEGGTQYTARSGQTEIRCIGFLPLPGMTTVGSQDTSEGTLKQYEGFVG